MSIVVGYPRNDAQLDKACEAECARAWDEQQVIVIELQKLTQEQKINADASAQLAIDNFNRGLDWLSETIDRVKGTADEDKLASLYDQFSDLRYEVSQIRKEWKV